MKKIKTLSEKGFTLIEMLIVLFVISVIMLLIIPNISENKKSIDETGNEAFANVVQTQLDLYEMSEGVTATDATAFEVLKTKGYLNENQSKRASETLKVESGKVSVVKGK